MNFELITLQPEKTDDFKKYMQEAFQKGAEEGGGCDDGEEVLPESHIDRSLHAEGSAAYEALVDGSLAGGAIVVVNENTKCGHLDFLFVKYGTQSKGVGRKIWQTIEALYPDVMVWETCTPYFEKRNIHFYVNCCGFHIVEYFNKRHPDPNDPGMEEEYGDDGFDGMFRFEKKKRYFSDIFQPEDV